MTKTKQEQNPNKNNTHPRTPANHTISFMELGSWNRSWNCLWGNAAAEQEFSHACLMEDGCEEEQ